MINFFSPKSVVIVGASSNPLKVGHLTLKNLINQGFKGKIYLVNKKGGEILGKKVYENLSQIKEPIDLVVLSIPADEVIKILDEIGGLGIKNLLIFSSGFKEIGEEGKKREEILIQKSRQYNFNILGPNCVGFINTNQNINLTFLKGEAKKGNIGIVSQSGALGSYLLDYFNNRHNLGFSYFFSLGNKTKIDEVDILKFLADDEKTKVIGCYFESIENGEKFKKEIKKIIIKKPVIILKPGKSKEAAKAALSHTGSIVGDDDVYQAIFNQNGIIRAENLDEFVFLLKLFSFEKIPLGKKALIITNAGGVGVLMTDELVKNNFKIVLIDEKVKNKILEKIPNASRLNIYNPIDLLGDAQAYDFDVVLTEALKNKKFDFVIVLLTPQANTEVEKTAEIVYKHQSKTNIPIYPVFLGGKSVRDSFDFFEKNKIVGLKNFYFLSSSLKKILLYQDFLKEENNNDNFFNPDDLTKKKILYFLKQIKRDFLTISETFSILNILKLPIVNLIKIKSIDDLNNLDLDFPVVAKINSEKIIHKTDSGGVILNINNIEELKKAYLELKKIDENIIIQKMIKGDEYIIGAKKDDNFGTVVIFGLGGIYTEIFKEIIKLVWPFSYYDLIREIKSKKFFKLLQGARGKKIFDLKKIYQILAKLAWLMENFKEIKEIDLNPAIIKDDNLYIVDGRVIKSL